MCRNFMVWFTAAGAISDERGHHSSARGDMLMKAQNLMTENPVTCTPEADLQEVARMMLDFDCGAIPVVRSSDSQEVAGVITDRDITIRAVAEGKNPLDLKVGDVMTRQVFTVNPETDAEDCFNLMEDKQVRRLIVVDDSGNVCGVLAQADVARHAPPRKAAEVVRDVSQPGA